MEKELHLSAALAQFQLSVFCFLLSGFFQLSCLSCRSCAIICCFGIWSGLMRRRVRDAKTQGLKDSGTLDPVGERNLIMAIAIEDVVTLLDQLREGLVEMRGYL
jgi:hypothetical protein